MKKVLMLGDAGCNTGFARVVKGVADHLHATGQYEVSVRGINYRPMHGIPYEYEVLPIRRHDGDPLGNLSIAEHIDETLPDVLWVVQDLWTIGNYMTRKPHELPTVAYFPVDTPNLKWSYGLALGSVSEAVTYTHFGAKEASASVRDALDVFGERIVGAQIAWDDKVTGITMPPLDGAELHVRLDRLARYQNPSGFNVIPHGMSSDIFVPRDRAASRRAFGLPEDAYIIGSVNTNQFRKRQDLTIRAFAMLRRFHPEIDAYLVFHCHGGDWQGWDLAQLARYYNVHDRVKAMHHRYQTLSDDDLCTLYNCFDVHVNNSGGEGWGLTSFESAACGVPQIVPNWSATRELWSGHALLTRVQDWRHEPKGLNTAHAVIDLYALSQQFLDVSDPEVRDRWGTRALARAQEQVTWDEVGNGFHQIIQNALHEPSDVATSFADAQGMRVGKLTSELSGLMGFEDVF